MRIIGHVPNEANATTFSDFLAAEGIGNEVEADGEGWAVWIHSEDEWQRAREMLAIFLANPRDRRYAGKTGRASEMRQRAVAEAEAVEKRTYDRRAVFRATTPYGVGALTTVIICLCVAITALAWSGYKEQIYAELLMTKLRVTDSGFEWMTGLAEIRSGEFWRLLTPAFVHIDPIHLLFNMMMLLSLGSMIEGRVGTGRLGLLVIVFGVVSDLAQYYVASANFNGFSGVNYGLFGYVWARSRLDPRSGLAVHPQTVGILVVWFFLCLTGAVGNVANMAHATGAGLGLLWGFLESLPSRRQPTKD